MAVEVVHRVRQDDCDARSLAELIKRDAVLTTELLKMVNNGLYNPSGRKITELHEAVARVGIRRIGEISLAVSTFKGLARLALPWFDTELTHVRSLAGCLLADHLNDSNTDPRVNQSVTFSALLFPLARAVVGAEFSDLYEKMLEIARDRQCALDEVEAEFLPVSPVKALVRLISQWNLPADLYAPLAHLEASPQELDQLPPLLAEAVRSLQRVLALVPFTVGRWMPWESVGVPPSHVLAPADPQRLAGLVEQVRGELKNQPGGPSQKVYHGTASPSHLKLLYARFGPAGHDWLRDVLNTFDFQLEDAAGAPHALPPGTVVNAVEATPEEIIPLSEQAATRNLLLFLPGGSQVPPGDPHFLVLPTSYRSLMMHCAQHASR
ncbi:MAG: hypothetical protein KatS3mg109_1367 [Pirellulaceae bacterium]|nr:MAG: hypothetical protein KatS3mg109_1367 [Pirellulaceae bacterium]